ncbi:uncharacterized protein PHACADRAFT_51634, partial [Phanerochaete carnosa HHB-10118-sp]
VRRLNDYKRFTMAVGTFDIARLKQLVAQGLKRGASAHTILDKMRDAADGLYKPRGYTTHDAEMAYLAKALGGPRLLFMLNHSLAGLPSARTIRKHMQVPELRPSVSQPTTAEIGANITSFCGPLAVPEPLPRSGHTLVIDGIAQESKARYDATSNQVLGLCREHSHMLDLRVLSVEAVKAIAAALHGDSPCCHYGSEATVAAMAPFRKDHYTIIPIMVSPTCKAETAEELAEHILMILRTWHESEDGERRHGPCWSVGTDGDAKFRTAKFRALTSKTLERGTPLHAKLVWLRGLNLQVGPYDVTADADPKHIFKRFNTLLCHKDGILVLDTVINRDVLAGHLAKQGMSSEKIVGLLDPNDPQNVPRAVQLLRSVIAIKHINLQPESSASRYRPDEEKEHRALSLLAEVYNTLLTPFITISMSLRDQFRQLIVYAHLAFYLYRKYRTAFMTSQLYHDTQHVIKSLTFNIAKQQLLEDTAPFYIIQLGQDRLEVAFADVRTQDHASNVDTLSLTRKLGTGCMISNLNLKHPSWNRGHRRLKFFENDGPDHINPASWTGDVTAGSVSLQWDWAHGYSQAVDIL